VRRPEPSPRAAAALTAALIAAVLYAAFDGGAQSYPAEARLQVAIAVLAALAGARWLCGGGLRVTAPRLAWAGMAMMAAFAVWSGITVLWSVAPNQTWIELNRALAYAVVLALSVAAGASHPRVVGLIARGFTAVVLAVTAYSVGQKLLPGLHIDGLFDLNQTSISPRLRAPLDYFNALALFIAMGVPLVLVAALDRGRSDRARLAALLTIPVMLLAIALTYSRGGLLALAVALTVGAALGGGRLRSLVAITAAVIAAAPAVAFAVTNPSLVNLGQPLSSRELAGLVLAVVLLVSLGLLWLVGRRLLARERARQLSSEQLRRIARRLLSAVAVLAACGVIAVAASHRGLSGTVSHVWNSFTSTKSASSIYLPNRLLSTDSGNRWVWWKEAAGAFADRPLAGWGAGSFPVLDLLYRRNGNIKVQQPHSVPLQFLAETGIVGGVLGVGAFALLLAVGVGTVRRRPAGRERVVGAALLAGAVAYTTQALYDWDWDIPAVTLPALILLGVLAGSRGLPARRDPRLPGPGTGARLVGAGVLTLVMCLYAVSAVLPSLAATKAQDAYVAASSNSRALLEQALATAETAARLDPLSDQGLTAAATISAHLGNLAAARRYLFDAVRRNPSDSGAWEQLATLETQIGDGRGLLAAAKRVLALNPRDPSSITLAESAVEVLGPPNTSATATGTPLPSTGP
jgi:hypothetical protein